MNEGCRRRQRHGHMAATLQSDFRLIVVHIGKILITSQPVSIFALAVRGRPCLHSILSVDRLSRTAVVENHKPRICHQSAPSQMKTKGAERQFCFRSVVITELPTVPLTTRVGMDGKGTKASQTRLIIHDGRSTRICQKPHGGKLSPESAGLPEHGPRIISQMSNSEPCLKQKQKQIE